MENTYDWACRLRFSGGRRHVYVGDRENVLKTYREVIDEMGKVSLSHINRLFWENRDLSRWTKTWNSVEINFRKIPWVEKSLFLGQLFTLATMAILILLKSLLNDQKWRFSIRKKSFKESGEQSKSTPPFKKMHPISRHDFPCRFALGAAMVYDLSFS